MTAMPFSFPIFRAFTTTGTMGPLAGGLLHTFEAGTSTPLAVYQDDALTTPHTNPVVLDSNGQATIYLGPNAYKMRLEDSTGSVQPGWPIDGLQKDTDTLKADLAASSGSSLVGFLQSGTGAVARTVQDKVRERVSVFDYMTPEQIADVRARTLTLDITSAVQAAHNAHDVVYYPEGTYKISATIAINRGAWAMGSGRASSILYFYGCDGFTIDGSNAGAISITDMTMSSVSAEGVDDPLAHTGIYSPGTALASASGFMYNNLFFRGWNICIDGNYITNGTIESCESIFCNYGLRYFGQSVNVMVSNCRWSMTLPAGGHGIASIDCVPDGAVKPEGLIIKNTLLIDGQFGIRAESVLGMIVSNCMIDLCSDTAIKVKDCKSLAVSNCWIYATNIGVDFESIGAVQQGSGLSNNHIRTTSATGVGVKVRAGNIGVSVTGGSITCISGGYCAYTDGDNTSVIGVNLVNPGPSPSVFFGNTIGNVFLGCTSNTSHTNNNKVRTSVSARLNSYRNGIAFAATVTPDCANGNYQTITATSNAAFTIAAPSNPPVEPETMTMTIAIKNAIGAPLGTATWDSVYLMGAWTQPSAGGSRAVTFQRDGDWWREISRTAADVPL